MQEIERKEADIKSITRGVTHQLGIRICACLCLLGYLWQILVYQEFSSQTKVYFEQITVKNKTPNLSKMWCFLYKIGILIGGLGSKLMGKNRSKRKSKFRIPAGTSRSTYPIFKNPPLCPRDVMLCHVPTQMDFHLFCFVFVLFFLLLIIYNISGLCSAVPGCTVAKYNVSRPVTVLTRQKRMIIIEYFAT